MQRRPLRALWLAVFPLLALSCLLTAPSDEELVGSCDDGRRNGGETDADCGGPCNPCGTGQGCAVDGDCASGVCRSEICEAASCGDGVKNGTETDTDCGGPDADCDLCLDGQDCRIGDDCESYSCVDGICAAPTCTDQIPNGDESDTDCGFACPTRCGAGLGCFDGTDCVSGVCDASGLCQ